MSLHPTDPRFVYNASLVDTLTVRKADQPFAQGAERNVYRLVDLSEGSERLLVGKESRRENYSERLSFHIHGQQNLRRASDLAQSFVSDRRISGLPPLAFVPSTVYRLRVGTANTFTYLAVEPRLDPSKYVKYNTNGGFVLSSSSTGEAGGRAQESLVAQAFSHFTFDCTGGEEMVVDLQGTDLGHLTDPQLHSRAQSYGRGDFGVEGFRKFFETHSCSCYCRALCLPLPRK